MLIIIAISLVIYLKKQPQYNNFAPIKMSQKRSQQQIDSSQQQAHQQQERIQQQPQHQQVEQQQQNAEDLQINDEADYEQIQELDRYEKESVDDEEYDDDPEARRLADIEIDKRKKDYHRADQMDDLMSDDERDYQRNLIQRNRRVLDAEQDDEQIDQTRYLDAEEAKGKLLQWIKQEETLKYIKIKFTRFLIQFKADENYAIYGEKLREMAINNKKSIQVSFIHLKMALPTIGIWTGLHPDIMLPLLNDIAYVITCKNYPTYKNVVHETQVRINDVPFIDQIRDLRYLHLGKLVRIKGVITIRSQVLNQMKRVYYKCIRCGEVKGPFIVSVNNIKMGSCSSCQSTGPFTIDKLKTMYRNYQKMTIQQSPSDVLPGRIPRNKQIICFGDLTDIARPGDQVEVIGIFKNRYDCVLNIKQGFPLFSTYIEAVHMIKCAEVEVMGNDPHFQEKIRKIAKQENIADKIYGSIAPSIYGHNSVKRGLTLAMFGGVPIEGVHRVRGDINVLLLGDPGIAKSQFLKSIQKVFHRCIYTTGKGASAVGLTASVKRDFQTNQWKLQAGALVLADKGICLIDQFDKMNQHDRTSIHEAMQQQSISISKAGIVASLRARCSVIAAANPIQGRYNSANSFLQNVDLSDPILSRFDILNVIKDEVDEQIDYKLSTFVINSHIKNHPYTQKYEVEDLDKQKLDDEQSVLPYIEHKVLRQYIKYAREKCHPQLSDKNREAIKTFFTQLRQASKMYSGMHVSVRQVESIIRISQAHAKMHLRNEVEKRDVDIGIAVLLESFIQTQKNSIAKELKKKFAKYLKI